MRHKLASGTPSAEDKAWASGFLRANLDLWLAASAQTSGLFYPFLDRQWQRTGPAPLTCVSQCRLIYNFSRGYEIWQSEAHANVVRAGIDALRLLAVYSSWLGRE